LWNHEYKLKRLLCELPAKDGLLHIALQVLALSYKLLLFLLYRLIVHELPPLFKRRLASVYTDCSCEHLRLTGDYDLHEYPAVEAHCNGKNQDCQRERLRAGSVD
jgi:hypothetical protein